MQLHPSYHHQLADVQAMDLYSPRQLATADYSLVAVLPRAAVLQCAGGTSLNMELRWRSYTPSYHHQLADVQAMDPYSPRELATDDRSLVAALPRASVVRCAGGASQNIEFRYFAGAVTPTGSSISSQMCNLWILTALESLRQTIPACLQCFRGQRCSNPLVGRR